MEASSDTMDPESENTKKSSPAEKKALTFFAQSAAILLLSAFFWFLLAPLLDIMHISFLVFVMQPFGMIFLLIWLIGVVFIWIGVSQYMEIFLNPLTPEEESDPLVREVNLKCTFDEAWDLCLKSPYAAGRLWYVCPDRPKLSLSAFWYGNVPCRIRIDLEEHSKTRYRVVITGREYLQFYKKTGSPTTWERSPQYVTGKDITRRWCVRTLDAIVNFLEEHAHKKLDYYKYR